MTASSSHRRRGVAPVAPVAIIALALALSGCMLDDGFFDHDECRFGSQADVEGTWTLRGVATDLSGCEGMTRMSIGPGTFEVVQDGGLIQLAAPRQGFSLEGGAVSSACVSFTTFETRGDSTVRLSFKGRASGRSIVGEWDGTLRPDCLLQGTFSVTIQ